jgi:hypothetical protein
MNGRTNHRDPEAPRSQKTEEKERRETGEAKDEGNRSAFVVPFFLSLPASLCL